MPSGQIRAQRTSRELCLDVDHGLIMDMPTASKQMHRRSRYVATSMLCLGASSDASMRSMLCLGDRPMHWVQRDSVGSMINGIGMDLGGGYGPSQHGCRKRSILALSGHPWENVKNAILGHPAGWTALTPGRGKFREIPGRPAGRPGSHPGATPAGVSQEPRKMSPKKGRF